MEALLAVPLFSEYSYFLTKNSRRSLCLSERKNSCHLVVFVGSQGNSCRRAGWRSPSQRAAQGRASSDIRDLPHWPSETSKDWDAPAEGSLCLCYILWGACCLGSWKGLLIAVRKSGFFIQNVEKKLHPSVFVVCFLSFIYEIKWSWSGSRFGEENNLSFQTIKYCWICYCLKTELWSGQRMSGQGGFEL